MTHIIHINKMAQKNVTLRYSDLALSASEVNQKLYLYYECVPAELQLRQDSFLLVGEEKDQEEVQTKEKLKQITTSHTYSDIAGTVLLYSLYTITYTYIALIFLSTLPFTPSAMVL